MMMTMMMHNKAACSQRQSEIISELHFAVPQALQPIKHPVIVSGQISSKHIRKSRHRYIATAKQQESDAVLSAYVRKRTLKCLFVVGPLHTTIVQKLDEHCVQRL